jgi:sn-glycerol 3-phosphate transport system substrate-binding protein
MAQKLTKKDAVGQGHAVRHPGAVVGLPVLAVPGLHDAERRDPGQRGRQPVRYDDPKVIEALQFWVDLSRKHGVHPAGVVEWGTTPKDFMEKKVAMIWTTTGNLTNIRTNAKFDFGVAMLPAGKKRGSPTGGGNFFIFKKATPAQQEAAFKFARWLTTPERAAQWGIDTGYVAVSPAAWDTPAMKKYAPTSRPPPWRATSCRTPWPSCPRTTTSA